ncbi:MAG: hypothetical protein COU35_04585 [Candidatus Magasanikbacteria bacterium CG10_big_fil_rev_8_21_14_0_10_47_10]|uniref:Response regulatory domain-containing protein n=1 Tax=Candidatus Magasanikbacteria bacterium CG10_big_fil_rev_8_21_14_0_10_47_10 TaxID=1974652 RepID=A0A2H0TRP5_9BACT|nr:MAG: hypothetical protein COU35_04585 [Candidatus Magasanikbacteria bacterium CG10_big_fil_rev_8_21_14_0_10_47_10]
MISKKKMIEKASEDTVILVLEDEQPLLDVIRIKLEKSGYEVITARSVEQALDYVKSLPHIHAMWVDHYLLGNEDALDFVKQVKKKNGKWADVPVLVVSNTVSDDKISAYLSMGVNKFYIKAQHTLDEIVGDLKKCIDDPEHCPVAQDNN